MSEAFGTISGDEKCIQNFGRNTWSDETTRNS
jgi:hypothetical protein